jgi:hypothetical protein
MARMMSAGQAARSRDHRSEAPLETRPGPAAERWLSRALVACAALILAAWVVIAVVHADDRYHVGWVEGTRIALARAAAHGELFPPLIDGQFYGGTRLMPGPVILHAGLSRVTGEYLVSGKLLAYLSTALLLVIVVVLLRRAGCPRAGALALAAGILATFPGLLAATTPQGDALSVALQLIALGLILHSQRRVATIGAAALCALAVVAKLTAVWAALAILAWLLLRDRRRLVLFGGAFLVLLVTEAGLLELLSGGRMLTNLHAVAFAGSDGIGGFVRSPTRALSLVADGASLVLVLFPVAFLGLLLRGRQALSLWLVSLLSALVVLLVVMADSGALHNHLLDLVVLTLLAAGDVWGTVSPSSRRMSAAGAAIAVVALWGLGTSFLLELRPDLEEAAREVVGATPARYASDPLAGELRRRSLLSEDPYVPVSLDRKPVVLDPWMLLRLGRKHPAWTSALAARIDAHQFDRIVLVYPIGFEAWYRQMHFGSAIAAAIRRSYRLREVRQGYYVYAPVGQARDAP